MTIKSPFAILISILFTLTAAYASTAVAQSANASAESLSDASAQVAPVGTSSTNRMSNSTAYTPDESGVPQPSRYIENPLAKKGLYKIETNGTYLYREPTPIATRTVSVRIGEFSPTNLVNPDFSNATYDQIYGGQAAPMIIYDYERPFFRSFGRLAWKLGTGVFLAQGHGIFVNQNRGNPPEEFTLLAIPLSAGVIYSLQFTPRQWFVPYAEAGGDYFGLTEIRSDKSAGFSGLAGAPTVHFSFGARVPLGFSVRSFLDLTREYGISVMYFTAEYRDYVNLSSTYDLAGSTISFGIAADY